MSFQLLPPEITSLQMYTGAGSGPMLAAAASWEGLGSELASAAQSFSSVTGSLPWQGAAAQAMTSVATQYVQWLGLAASQAGGAASQAKAVSGIFEAAKAAVTHPTTVSINRQQLVQLIRSNLFGFNAPAIAATEGAYEGMWAKNVASLSGYHSAASAVAAQLTPWAQALQSLPGAASQSPGAAIAANTQANMADVRSANSSDLARTQALSKSKLTAAGEVLAGRQETFAATTPASRVVQASRLVGQAAAIDTGTGMRVAARTAAVAPLSAAQAGDIVGGAGPLKSVGLERLAAASPLLQTSGGDGVGQTANAYNQAQVADLSRLSAYQTATTKQLTAQHLDAARAALDGRQEAAASVPTMDGVRRAAREVAEAAALNVGTGAQEGVEKVALAPTLLGADLDIAGGGDELLYSEEYY